VAARLWAAIDWRFLRLDQQACSPQSSRILRPSIFNRWPFQACPFYLVWLSNALANYPRFFFDRSPYILLVAI
jgi:hypothetical protein